MHFQLSSVTQQWPVLARLTAGAEPPCGWRSEAKLGLKCCKGKPSLKRILDSKVGSSDWLGGGL
jgi:hypothetical protein